MGNSCILSFVQIATQFVFLSVAGLLREKAALMFSVLEVVEVCWEMRVFLQQMNPQDSILSRHILMTRPRGVKGPAGLAAINTAHRG